MLKGKAEPTVICFINGYSMIVIGDNQFRVTIIKIEHPDNYSFKLKLVSLIEVSDVPTHFLLDVNSSK